MKKKRTPEDTQFKSWGIGLKYKKTQPVSVGLPEEMDKYVRSRPNRSEWLRAAVREKMERERETVEE